MTTSRRRLTKNERGQFTIEAVLLMTILVGVVMAISKASQANGWASALAEGPWEPMRGMIEDGVWQPTKKAKAQHPALIYRHATYKPD